MTTATDTDTQQWSKLDEGLKATWLNALRSGNYEQGRSALRTLDRQDPSAKPQYCCLGVLCDLKGATWKAIKQERYDYVTGAFEQVLPPVCEFSVNEIDLNDNGPDKFYGETVIGELLDYDTTRKLASMNDTGDDFETIANWIEVNL